MTIDVEQIKSVAGHGKVFTESGEKVGDVGQVYLDDSSGTPTWVTVKTGLFGTAESFVPLEGARVEGENVVVAFDKETIKDAPRVEADGSITPDQEHELFRHYGLRSPGAGDDRHDDRHEVRDTGRDTVGRDIDRDAELREDQLSTDRSGRRDGDDDAMTRSEEQLRVDTQTHVAGRAVLRKYVVTEYVTQTVPVRREEVRLEREPITDANRGDLVDEGVAFEGDADLYEVILHQEVPVVQTETVAVERVKLRKETRTDQATVSEDVRKEKLDLDDPNESRRVGDDRDVNDVDDNRTR